MGETQAPSLTDLELVCARLRDFFAHNAPWHRRLWGIGTVLGLREVLEYADGCLTARSRSAEGLCFVVSNTRREVGRDPGVAPMIESGSPRGSDVEREHLEAYRTTHDLAEAVQGAVMPALWIVRDGNSGWAASTASTARVPFHELLDVLREVGDCITSRLNGVSDNRSRRAIQAWKARHGHNRLRVIEAATGYLPERAPPQLGAGGHRGEPA